MKLEFSRHFERSSNINLHKNPTNGIPVVRSGQTDMTKLIAVFCNFACALQYICRTCSPITHKCNVSSPGDFQLVLNISDRWPLFCLEYSALAYVPACGPPTIRHAANRFTDKRYSDSHYYQAHLKIFYQTVTLRLMYFSYVVF